MFRTDQPTAVSSIPTPAAAGTPGYFTGGNPGTGTPATILDADWLNMIQQELINVVAAAGETPSKTTYNQVLTAIQTLMQNGASNVGTDTGAANAYVVAFTPALSAPVPFAPFWVKIKTANTGASTLNASGTVYPLVGGAHLALQGGELVANGNALVYWNPTLNSNAGAYVLLFCSGAAEQIAPATASQHAVQLGQINQIQPISAAVASNSLTATLSPTALTFRSATLNSGAVSTIAINSSLSLTVPAGATLGTANATMAVLALLAIDNGGAVQLGIINLNGAPVLDESNLISTTAISSAATSGGVIYSATACTNCPWRLIGFISATEATAGTWATAPSLVQGAAVPMQGFGASLGTSGYQKFPNGLIMQWGRTAASVAGGSTQLFPIAFPNNFFTCTLSAVSAAADFPTVLANAVAAGFNFAVWNTSGASIGGLGCHFIAFGN